MSNLQPTGVPAQKQPLLSDDWAYILPMAVFLGITYLGATWPQYFAASYVVKTVLTAAVLLVLRKQYTRIAWHYWWLGAMLGVVSIMQWIALDKGVLAIWPNYPRVTGEPFNPFTAIHNRAWLYTFLAVRWMGPTLVVPFMEEFFWRDFAWRSIIAPNDFHLADIGEWDWKAFAIVTLLFASVHQQWITAIVWGATIAWLLYFTRSLGTCIIMHAVANFLLGAYVLHTGDWQYW